jgi:hypothetical protein
MQGLPQFLETPKVISHLASMEQMNLLEAEIDVQPWSGDYWAYAKGILGARYFDPQFMKLSDWLARLNFINANPASLILQQQGAKGLEILSASEKYDLLIGDSKSTFTGSMWAQGKLYYDQFGQVENWMGICHGWAPAAMMEARPQSSVSVKSMDGIWDILLKPAEIKGLISYNWATNTYKSAYLGSRCNKKSPQRDENGRLIDPECFDLNPSIWHMAVVNQLGVNKRSLIMDASYDYEVWNQPLLSYSYSYFNVISQEPALDLAGATVAIQDYPQDPFKKYRGPQSKFLVGISMKVGYVVETSVNQSDVDSPTDDEIRWVTYNYDLELDSAGKIIGGEWHQLVHPDFIWTPMKNTQPKSVADRVLQIQDWDGRESLPLSWSEAAKMLAPYGQILNSITTVIGNKSK